MSHHPVTMSTRAVFVAVALAVLQAPVQAAAPAGRYACDGAACTVAVSTDTVLDTATALVWQRTPAPSTSGYTWAAAGTYCQGLTLGGFAVGSWRLPAKLELETLVDDSVYDPAIDTTAFSNTPALAFWSSSPYAGNTGSAWVVYFNDGTSSNPDVSVAYQVRCVR